MRVAFTTLVYCPLCFAWLAYDGRLVVWREHGYWCMRHTSPTQCAGTTSIQTLPTEPAEVTNDA
jgi:hypothetical protein